MKNIKEYINKDNIWVLIIASIICMMLYSIFFNVNPDTGEREYYDAYKFIIPGLSITFICTLASFGIALIIGLFAGVGRISKNTLFKNISRAYIEFIRGVPVIILLFTVAFVIVVDVAELFNLSGNQIPMILRAIIALAFFYGAYIAEVFRAGIESVGKGTRSGGNVWSRPSRARDYAKRAAHTYNASRIFFQHGARKYVPRHERLCTQPYR